MFSEVFDASGRRCPALRNPTDQRREWTGFLEVASQNVLIAPGEQSRKMQGRGVDVLAEGIFIYFDSIPVSHLGQDWMVILAVDFSQFHE